MRVFVSWSGSLSEQYALVMRDWLPQVLQYVRPFMSEDISKGARPQEEIARALEESDFGVMCITRENQGRPWINFEAGALSKSVSRGRVACLLLDLDYSQVKGPLESFQHTSPEQLEGVTRLMQSVNDSAPEDRQIDGARVTTATQRAWPDLIQAFARAREVGSKEAVPSAPARTTDEMLSEVVELSRDLNRRLGEPGREGSFGWRPQHRGIQVTEASLSSDDAAYVVATTLEALVKPWDARYWIEDLGIIDMGLIGTQPESLGPEKTQSLFAAATAFRYGLRLRYWSSVDDKYVPYRRFIEPIRTLT